MKTVKNLLIELAEGHPGSAVALIMVAREAPDPVPVYLALDDQGLRGVAIWDLYHDVCHEDVYAFIGQVLGRC